MPVTYRLLNFGVAVAGFLALVVAVLIVIGVLRAWWARPFPVFGFGQAPEQPIPFPHTKHVQAGIQCEFCHRNVTMGDAATVPSLQQCMFCHSQEVGVAEGVPSIEELQARFAQSMPVNWWRVHRLPDSVRFKHEPHVRFFTTQQGMDVQQVCSLCHGDVGSMVVVEQVKDLKMGDCVDCHRDYGAPTDCTACHY